VWHFVPEILLRPEENISKQQNKQEFSFVPEKKLPFLLKRPKNNHQRQLTHNPSVRADELAYTRVLRSCHDTHTAQN
jgi:hypothetical protein